MAAEQETWTELADLIDQQMAQLGWSQTDLVRESRVAANTVRALQRAERTSYRPNTLRAVSRALGWSPMAIEVFVGGGDPPSIGKKALTDELDRAHQGRARQVNTAAALSGKIDRLTPGQRATIEALVDQLLGED